MPRWGDYINYYDVYGTASFAVGGLSHFDQRALRAFWRPSRLTMQARSRTTCATGATLVQWSIRSISRLMKTVSHPHVGTKLIILADKPDMTTQQKSYWPCYNHVTNEKTSLKSLQFIHNECVGLPRISSWPYLQRLLRTPQDVFAT